MNSIGKSSGSINELNESFEMLNSTLRQSGKSFCNLTSQMYIVYKIEKIRNHRRFKIGIKKYKNRMMGRI